MKLILIAFAGIMAAGSFSSAHAMSKNDVGSFIGPYAEPSIFCAYARTDAMFKVKCDANQNLANLQLDAACLCQNVVNAEGVTSQECSVKVQYDCEASQ